MERAHGLDQCIPPDRAERPLEYVQHLQGGLDVCLARASVVRPTVLLYDLLVALEHHGVRGHDTSAGAHLGPRDHLIDDLTHPRPTRLYEVPVVLAELGTAGGSEIPGGDAGDQPEGGRAFSGTHDVAQHGPD